MSTFDDLLSSARGPGVIGTLLALVVLVGFSGLYLLAFEKGSNGGSGLDLASEIKHQDVEIENLHDRISLVQKSLEAVPALEKKVMDIEAITKSTRLNQGTLTGLQNLASTLRGDVESSKNELLAYKAEYRAYMRDKAKGEQIEEITTLSGKTYKHVVVREVTPIGMQIRHDDGFTRIPCDDLPQALQDRFQFDPQEKLAAMKAESSSEQNHIKKVEEADAIRQVQASADRANKEQEDKAKMRAQVAMLEAQIKMIDIDILDLQKQAARSRAQTAASKAEGHRVLGHSNEFEYAIQTKKNERADMQNRILVLKSKL